MAHGILLMHTLHLELQRTTAVRPSPRVMETASMFGLGVDEERSIAVVPPCDVPLPTGGVVFVTGPSGGGKSSILSLIAQQCRSRSMVLLCLDDLAPLPDVPLVDVFDIPLDRATSLLAMAGLGDAFVMLRRPGELSDGQRYRLRLAQAMHEAEQSTESIIMLADEFAATLDRMTAAAISRNIHRWIHTTQHTFICATTHDDLLEPLEPDVLIYKGLGEHIEVLTPPPHR